MRVDQIMTKQVATCRPEDTLQTAARLMWEKDCGCVPVVDQAGTCVGVVTDRDICMAAYFKDQPLGSLAVSTAMSKSSLTCKSEDSIEAAEAIMQGNQIRRLPVVNASGRIVGILSLNDIAREAARERGLGRQDVSETEVAYTLAAVCEPHGKKQGQQRFQGR